MARVSTCVVVHRLLLSPSPSPLPSPSRSRLEGRVVSYLGGALAQVCPLLRLVEEAKLARSLCAPDDAGGGTRGVEPCVGKVASACGPCASAMCVLSHVSSGRAGIRWQAYSWAARNWRWILELASVWHKKLASARLGCRWGCLEKRQDSQDRHLRWHIYG